MGGETGGAGAGGEGWTLALDPRGRLACLPAGDPGRSWAAWRGEVHSTSSSHLMVQKNQCEVKPHTDG